MDIATIAGLGIAWAGLMIGALLAGTNLLMFLNIEAFFIVIVGTIGVTIICFPMAAILNSFAVLKNAFFAKEIDFVATIQTMVNFATKARREGLLGLEEDVEQLDDKFLQKGLQLIVDGTDIELVRSIMDTDLTFLEVRHKLGEGIFMTMGGYAPTLGIVGTVMGLVHVLAKLDDPSKIGPAVAVAFIATLYGIATANLIYLPIGMKLRARSAEEILLRNVMIEGVVAISQGDNPRIVEEKLKAFLPPKYKQVTVSTGRVGAGEEPPAAAGGAGAARR